MPEKDFQQEVIDRLARIETKQDATSATVGDHAKAIFSQGLDIVRIDARARSAHHRLDGIYAAAGVLGGIAGALIQLVWPKSGGH